ncbi:GDSL-type esterase/lipase family protein [Capnocytophaga canimorsus]|uniref:PAF-AH subunit gamma n=1 Tax=Capnocytophaga canimorsus (strain 5) TaxID=860228 RepID=F9YVA1_CAPCC|nr:GDSL-type esterase/lipase family protein [Capnocytophaga canimorsus]AEK23146.1 PAF-AH subunit gamma [Capnocytophaga canimorsus Cc5]WGU71133.1 GDSL-type esterase/lipase family protein [Capnocytophaga canimorsus]CEN45981.1 PAF-AH subunit gamma [Capnocytophaga canimorsus]VEJ18263.1 Argininosuccinate lyase [Capnocytophaga canimorsus]
MIRNTYIVLCLCCFFKAFSQQDSIYHRHKIWKSTIEQFEAEDKITPPQSGAILFVGSSSFTNWKNLDTYFPNKKIINRGFGGSELKDVIFYFDRIVTPYKPKQIVLYEGDNDIVFGQTAEEYFDDVKTFVRLVRLHLPGTPILLLSIKKSPARSHYTIEFDRANALMYQYAQTQKTVQFVDVTSVLFDTKGEMRKDCFLSDNLHINEKGYQLWADLIRGFLLE